jgi:transcriptional regulator with XRE-family HTH domain
MNGVKYYRIKRGLSREKLSGITGISIPTLKKWKMQ